MWLEVKGKAPRADFEHPSEELVDLVRICTAASRCGYGNLVWLGWQPGMPGERVKEPNRVGFGSQLIAVSVQGAARLARRMPGADPVGENDVDGDTDGAAEGRTVLGAGVVGLDVGGLQNCPP